MEGELNVIQKQYVPTMGASAPIAPKFPDISFVPQRAVVRGGRISPRMRDIFATAGLILGGIALVSWFVIVVGIAISLLGIVFSLLGRNSSHTKNARIGLVLSAVGGGLALIYMLAIYMGLINYNYFTNELWGIPAGGVQTLE